MATTPMDAVVELRKQVSGIAAPRESWGMPSHQHLERRMHLSLGFRGQLHHQ